MVAKTIPFPNVRRIFIPDPGYYIAEADLSGAEAQVVAWDAGDEDLKAAFRAGINIHIKNTRDVFPERVVGWSDEAMKAADHPGGVYFICKRCVHALHNGGAPRGLARKIGITLDEAERFQRNWFGLHPAILARHKHIADCLNGRVKDNPPRTLFNKFGYRIIFFDRIDNILPEALTWIQQSTVRINCFRSGTILRTSLPWVKLLLQVHDSLVFQFPISQLSQLPEIKACIHSVIVPYPDPLCIPWKLKLSEQSWGDAKDVAW